MDARRQSLHFQQSSQHDKNSLKHRWEHFLQTWHPSTATPSSILAFILYCVSLCGINLKSNPWTATKFLFHKVQNLSSSKSLLNLWHLPFQLSDRHNGRNPSWVISSLLCCVCAGVREPEDSLFLKCLCCVGLNNKQSFAAIKFLILRTETSNIWEKKWNWTG